MDQLKFLKKLVIAAFFLLAAVFYLKSGAEQESGEMISLNETSGAVETREVLEKAAKESAASFAAADAALLAKELSALLPRCSCEEKKQPDEGKEGGSGDAAQFAQNEALDAAPQPGAQYPSASAEEKLRQSAVAALSENNMSAEGAMASSLVNINTAGREALMTLPGIGEAKADAIIRYRTEYGAFAHIEEIMNISGIKEAAFMKLKDRITV